MRLLVGEPDPYWASELAMVVRWGKFIEPSAQEHKREIDVEVAASKEAFEQAFLRRPPDLALVNTALELDIGTLHGTAVIAVSAVADVDGAVEAIRRGAVDYITLPPDPARLAAAASNGLRQVEDAREIRRLRTELARSFSPERMVGASAAMRAVRALIQKAGPSSTNVLISGETGTGKDLVARAIHHAGPRRGEPILTVDGGLLTLDHIVQTEGGSLLIDEIADIPIAEQARILRALDSYDVRIIATTTRADGDPATLRQELYFRVAAFSIELPPLRDRGTDILALAEHFVGLCRSTPTVLSAQAQQVLIAHQWPGNVRELAHAIERAALVCEGDTIDIEHLPPAIARRPGARSEGLIEAVESLERRMIVSALEAHDGVKAKAAKALGVTPRILRYKMINLGVDP